MTRWGSVSCGNKHTEGVQIASPDRYFGVAHSGGLVPPAFSLHSGAAALALPSRCCLGARFSAKRNPSLVIRFAGLGAGGQAESFP